MATGQLNRVVKHLHATALLADDAALGDAQLLERYLTRREEAAFAGLVRRHGPMVLGVCRRVLRNAHDAEDAFQATFLVLVRKAASIRPRGMVGNWLYGVACRTAAKARARHAKRRAKELAMPAKQVRPDETSAELQALVEHELRRLPDKYRAALVLCELEGRTRKEAARRLGWPEGTVATRLIRARALLAKRLTRQGVGLPAALLTLGFSQGASASLPAPLVVATVKAASLFAAGQASAAMASAAALAQGVLTSMLITKLKIATALLVVAGVLGLLIGADAYQAQATEPTDSPPAVKNDPASVPPPARRRTEVLPLGSAPHPALVGLDDKGLLVIRSRSQFYEPVTSFVPPNRAVTSYRLRTHETKQCYDLAKTKVYDTSGKVVPAKQVLKVLLKGELLALTAEYEPVDALHLRLVKDDTLVFVLPVPEGVQPPAPVIVPQAQFTPALPAPVIVPPPAARLPPPVDDPAVPQPLPPPAPVMVPPTRSENAGEHVRVANIVIVGNEATPDRVIRKAVGLLPGAVLTFQDLRSAERNLVKLKLFRRATVSIINDGAGEHYRDILVSVEEKLDPTAKEMKRLEGAWSVESVNIGGNKTRPGSREFVFEGNLLKIRADKDGLFSFKLDVSRSPAIIELTAIQSDDAGFKRRSAIYEIQGDTLRLCIRPGDESTPPSEFSDNGQMLMTLKRKTKN